MEPQLQYSLLCLGYDETKGPPTFQNVLHELILSPLPYQFPEGSGLFLAQGWHGLQSASTCRVLLEGPEGERVADCEWELSPNPNSHFTLSLVFLEALNFERAGRHRITCWLGDRQVTQYPLEVLDAES